MRGFNVILFDNFQTLDAFGPVEVMGQMPKEYKQGFFSLQGGLVTGRHGFQVMTEPFSAITPGGVLLIPGGIGTRKLVGEADYIDALRVLAADAAYLLTVCTGSALLAKTGLLDGKSATSNKIAFDWVVTLSDAVNWVRKARWVADGNIYTSSGVSAGMDMTLGFISDHHGEQVAANAAAYIEYIRNKDSNADPFA